MDREAWWATVHGVTKSWTRLSDLHTHMDDHGTILLMIYLFIIVEKVPDKQKLKDK